MRIDHITSEHWQRVPSIRNRALWDAPDAFATTIEELLQIDEATWRTRLAAEEKATFLANLDGLDVGMAVGAPYENDAGLYAMWVAPEARGRGAGDALVQAVLKWAAQRVYVRIFLDVGDTNKAAIALYDRNGFEPTGVTGTLGPTRDHIKEHQRCRQI